MKTLLTPSAPVYLKLCFASQLLCPHFKLSVYYKQYMLIQSPSPGANVLKDPERTYSSMKHNMPVQQEVYFWECRISFFSATPNPHDLGSSCFSALSRLMLLRHQ